VIYIAIGGIVFFHGLLHFSLYTFLNPSCVISADLPTKIEDLGWGLYLVFAFFLCLIIFGIGFTEQLDSRKKLKVLLLSVVTTIFTYLLAQGAGTDWILSALFATSHPIGSVTGLLSTSPTFSKFMGWAFLLATIDGIVELMWCEHFLKPKGGHIWYDLFLHTAVIASLPIFVGAPSKKKIN
jgi:hypothetical protein